MKKLRIKATLINGQERVWRFVEDKNDSDYGNGIYIGVDRGDEKYCIDARYMYNYDFEEICANEIKAFYGDNLSEYEIIINPSIVAVKELARRISDHYPHTVSIQNTIDKELNKIVTELEEKDDA